MIVLNSQLVARIGVVAVLGGVIVLAFLYLLSGSQPEEPLPTPPPAPATSTPEVVSAPTPWQRMTVIGSSVEGRAIEAHSYGTGSTSILFVGGIHGGYEWNSVVLAYQVMDYLAENPDQVPLDLTVHIIPNLNPDGTYLVTGKTGRVTNADIPNPTERVATARFNARGVDLNRNFDCKWQPSATWRGQAVGAGEAPFSEPEAAALRDFVLSTKPRAALFWHSQAGNVYGSECEAGILPETMTLMNTYATAGDYGAVPRFDAYPVVGDAEGWLAAIGIPAVTVELETFNSSEWERNWAGVAAVLAQY